MEEIQVEIEEAPPVEVNLEAEEGMGEAPLAKGKEGEAPEPPPDHPRFKQVYGKMKALERDLEKTREEVETERAAARDHNQKLVAAIEKMSNRTVESIEAKESKDALTAQLSNLADALENLEDQKAEALKDGDYKASVRIDREIRKVERALEMTEAESRTKPSPKPKGENREGGGAPPLDPDIENFVKENKWFNEDPLMTGAARELDLALSQRKEWQGKPLKSRLQEVKRVIEERFAWKGTKPSGAESTLNQPGGKVGDSPTKIRLSADQVAAARGLGLTPTEYAHQLVLMGGGK